MKYKHFSTAILALPLLLTGALATAAEIGSIADSRFGSTWTLDGTSNANTRAKLLNTANFGLGGTVTEPINITDTAATISPGLLSSFDVFFIGFLDDSHINAFSVAELNAMTDYVNNGGTMIVTCDHPDFDTVCSYFGFPVTTSSSEPVLPTAAGLVHPLFSGPFGSIPSLTMGGTQGYFTSTVGATILAVDSATLPIIMEYQQGSGTVILMSDVNIISDSELTGGGGVSNNNDNFLGNLFAYAMDYSNIQPPLTYTIGGTISGLSGNVSLQNNGIDGLTRSANGAFTFATALTDTSTYDVTISAQPASQTCSVTDGVGTISAANITDVAVDCVDNSIPPVPVPAPAVPVPTLSSWALMIFSLLIGLMVFANRRRLF